MSVRGLAVLLRWFALGLRMALRFCWNVWRSVHACLFSFVRKKETACDALRFYSAGSRSPFARSRSVSMVICLWQVHFGFVRFLQAISTGLSGNGVRGWRRRLCASLRNHIGLAMLSAGSTLGAARPQTCAKESSTLWTFFTLRRGCVGADSLRRHPGTRVDPTGSNLWPGGSCCIAMLSTRTNVQTRAAPKRRGVGLRARSGVEAGTAGRAGRAV